MKTQLAPEQKTAVSRIGGLILTNAMIFQEILADHHADVLNLQKILGIGNDSTNLAAEFANHWQFIMSRINYSPIFRVASDILSDLTADPDIANGLRGLAQTAQTVVGMRAALHHDLMGRVYHRLLAEAKYLGTYYTSIPAATLLLKLALRPSAWQIDWNDLEQLRKFRVADLACGTGTLLMAAADVISDNYISAAAERGDKINLEALHNILVERIINGYDVLTSALHLTASTLALRAPHISFYKMNLTTMPLGGKQHRLGSIEFLPGGEVRVPASVFGAAPGVEQVTGEGMETLHSAFMPELDLCVMNPPFTRSVGGNLLFGSLPDDERAELQKRLKKLVSRKDVMANSTAGLGSVFVAAADPYIKPGGRLALVLPKALLSGVAWGETRKLINRKYQIEYLVASQDAERWNFSESTDLSEVLLVARKRTGEAFKDSPVVGVNLWRNPTTSFEALAIAQAIIIQNAPDIVTGQGALDLTIGKEKVGEAIALLWSVLKEQESWLLPCSFAQADLFRAAYHLAQN